MALLRGLLHHVTAHSVVTALSVVQLDAGMMSAAHHVVPLGLLHVR